MSSGKFGTDCEQDCMCKNDALCDRFTGECKCTPGGSEHSVNTPVRADITELTARKFVTA